MAFEKHTPSDGLYLENTASDGTEAMSTGLPALYDLDKTTPASPTNDFWKYHYSYGLDLGSVKYVHKLICYDHIVIDGWYGSAWDSVKVFKSDDNVSYVFVEQFDGPTRMNSTWELLLGSKIQARYLKVFNTEGASTLAAPTGASLKVTEIEAYEEILGRLSGTVNEKGVSVQRMVRCYTRSDGVLYDSVLSNPDGTFQLLAPDDTTLMFVIAFDDIPGDQYNSLIFDRVVGYMP